VLISVNPRMQLVSWRARKGMDAIGRSQRFGQKRAQSVIGPDAAGDSIMVQEPV
jgi:hypothetical protein